MTMAPVTFAADGLMSVQIDVGRACVDIVSSPRADVVVSVTPSNAQRSGDRAAAEQVLVDRKDQRISVAAPFRWNLFGSSPSVDIRIELPEAFGVGAHIKYGSLRVTGPVGAVQARIDYGDANLEACERLDLQGGHGDMRIGRVAGDAEVTLASGSVRIGQVGQDLKIKAGHGSTEVATVGGHADITTAGAIDLGTAGDALSARSAYGGVRIGDLVRGTARIETSYGSVHLGVRPGTAVWLDASSQHGAVRSDLASDPGPATDEETLTLQVHTNHGDIVVQRSGAPASLVSQTESTSS
ncbi:DUF4097 family beta strand repeat-containing protein [Phenylobacterium sp.]|uniref:DUF4097 family beta strand repeat-containing protein n=1 Tax=Phenylobacterium sp. TaxID=1871053 RepID=UPI00374CCAE1